MSERSWWEPWWSRWEREIGSTVPDKLKTHYWVMGKGWVRKRAYRNARRRGGSHEMDAVLITILGAGLISAALVIGVIVSVRGMDREREQRAREYGIATDDTE